jgi:outer membrane protein OmpA-like peptidoglycan-associated protein
MKQIIRSTTGALVAGMIAAGCATQPPASDVAAANTAISNAGQAVDHAAADPHVTKYASSELERATDSLQKAKTAWNDKHDLPATKHLAYVAQQRAATAQELANARVAENSVAVTAAKRDQAVAAAQRRAGPNATKPGLAGFASGAAKLPANARPTVDQLAATLKNHPQSKVVIEGHTDNTGDPGYNQTLAMKRAEAVRSALVSQGIDPSRISVRSLGEQNPVASNDTSAGRRENRRAQVIIGDMAATMTGSSGSAGATSSGQSEQGKQNKQGEQSKQSEQSEQSGERK